MKNVVRLAIVDPNDASRAMLKSLMMGMDMVWLEAECSRYEFFADVVTQTQPDIALISIDADVEKALALVATITQQLPNCSVLVASESTEGNVILQAMRNGAKEFLSRPLKLEEFLSALDRVQQSIGGGAGDGQHRSSKVITIIGTGGGVGCTSLAVNLAAGLARNESISATVIDLDFALGDADVWLDIIPDYTIQDVAENITRLEYALLKRSLTKHACGAFLLPRPVQIDDAANITVDQFKRVIALLRATFTHLIIDVSKSFGPLDLVAMESADSVLLVTMLDLPCLRNVVRLLQHFEQFEGLLDKIKIVFNRIGLEEEQISIGKATETIGRDVFWQLPNDYNSMVESRNNGVPLLTQAPKAKLTKSVLQLAEAIDDASAAGTPEETKKEKRRLFGFLSSGSK